MKKMNKNESNKYQSKNVFLVSAAHLLHDTYSAFLAPILPILIESLGISVFLAGFLDVIRKLPMLFNPFIGLIADRVCLKYFIIIAPAITAITMSFLGSADTYFVVAILLFISGISGALFHVPAPVIIKKISSDRIGKGMSYYMFGRELARTLGPLIILGAISIWGIEGTWVLSIFGIVASFILYLKLKDLNIKKDVKSEKDKITKLSIKPYVPFFISIFGFSFFRSGMKAALTIYLPTYLIAKGETLWLAGIALATLQISGAIGTYIAGNLSDKIGRKKILYFSSVLTPILMLVFLYLEGYLLFPLLIAIGFFLFGVGPVMLALIHDIKSKRMSVVNGTYMTLNFLSASVTVMLVGLLSDIIGFEQSFLVFTFVAFLSIPFIKYINLNVKEV